ncbi:MAG: tetratricopeptide repeat protein [Vampirovibrionales bacterium]|nr:tetratricopeptide repeat protein [Vampirovibrionales bacterium]
MARLIPPRTPASRRLRPSLGPQRGAVQSLNWPNPWSTQWLVPWFKLGPAGQALATIIAALIFSGLVFSGLLVFRSSDQDDLLAQGQRDLAEGRVARSVQTLQQLVRQNPGSFEGQLALGKAYLTLGDVDAARETFNKAFRLKPAASHGHSNESLHSDVALALAQSQLQLTEGAFQEAADPIQELLATYSKQLATADRIAIQSTLTDIHQAWGDSLLAPNMSSTSEQDASTPALKLSNLKEAIAHYQQALQTVQTYAREKALKQKLLALLEQWLEGAPTEGTTTNAQDTPYKTRTRKATVNQSPQEAIAILEPLVRWLPEPDLLIRLGDLYLLEAEALSTSFPSAARGFSKNAVSDAANTPYDTAIAWYRQAYQAAPHGVGVKLAHVLALRGKIYLKANQDALAAADFKESDMLLGRSAGDESLATPSLLYPISIKTLSVAPNVNKEAHTLQPSATVTLISEAHRPLQHLMARVQILSGSKVLGEWTNIVATPKKPLGTEGLPLGRRTWSVKLKEPVSLDLLTSGGSLRVTTSISYDMPEEGKKPSWELKRVQEIRIQPKKVLPPTTSATSTPPLPNTPAMPSTTTAVPASTPNKPGL